MKRVLGILFLLGGVFCGLATYMGAGGMHGEFRFDKIGRNDTLLTALGMGALLLLGAVLTFTGKKKKPAA
jgi:LPXTG-motif cell wall-anchored protein